MTVYWGTIALVGYLVVMARAFDPSVDSRAMGRLPENRLTQIFLLSAAVVLAFVAGFRWQVGADFNAYMTNYGRYSQDFFEDLRTFNEPGIKAIAWLLSSITTNATWFIVVVSGITIGLILLTIARYSIATPMSYMLFIFVGTWHGSFNGLRQYLAAAIVFAGHRWIIERRPIKFVLLIGLASSFHLSALALLPLYLLPNRRLRPAMLMLLGAASLTLLYSSDAVLNLSGLIKGEDTSTTLYSMTAINPLRILVAVLPVALYYTNCVRTKEDDEWFYRNIIIVHAVVMTAASYSAYLGRFGIYTSIFLPLALPRLIDFPDRQLTTLIRGLTIALFAAFWYIDVSGSSALNDFRFVFDK